MSVPACGNRRCQSGTSAAGGLTFGSGNIDSQGFFEFPCRVCSQAWTDNLERTKEAIYERMIFEGQTPEEAMAYIKSEEYLITPSWPYVK